MKKMSRSQKRAVRREAFRRTAGATTVADGARKSRGMRARARLRRAMLVGSAVMGLVAVLMAKPAMASINEAPEIDPGSMAGAMTLLVGGVLSLTGRVRRD